MANAATCALSNVQSVCTRMRFPARRPPCSRPYRLLRLVLPRPFVAGEEKRFSSLLPCKKRPGNEAIVRSAENRSRGELCRLNIVICLMCMLLASPECIWARPPSFAQKCTIMLEGEDILWLVGSYIRDLYTYGKTF